MPSAADLGLTLPSPLSELHDPRLRHVRVLLKRDDLIGGDLGGNKWRKLAPILNDVRRSRASTLLTFGGAYSNHIRAVAAAGRMLGLRTIGVIRGEERPFNASLGRAVECGMSLHYVARSEYRRKDDPAFLVSLRELFGEFYLIPEGGSSPLSVPGCAAIATEIDAPFDVLCCPVGTGGTLAGLSAGLGPRRRAQGFAVLRGAGALGESVRNLQRAALGQVLGNWSIDDRFHFGGFARRTAELEKFADDFADRHGIALERTYVAKMLVGVFHSIAAGEFEPGTTVVVLITGAPWPPVPHQANSTPSSPT